MSETNIMGVKNDVECWYSYGQKRKLIEKILSADGIERWYKKGRIHRPECDGPAIIDPRGTVIWCQNGEYHRLNGPSFEWANGKREWYLVGFEFSETCHRLFLKAFKQVVKSYRFKKWTRTRAFCEYYYQPDKIGGILAKRAILNSLKT